MLKGLIFDLDGIITDTINFHYITWKKAVKEIGIDLDKATNYKVQGLVRKETLLKILELNNFDLSKIDEAKINKICDKKNKYYLSLIKNKMSEENILPGILNLLKIAKKEKLKIAIASSSKNSSLILTKMNIIHFFDYIVNLDEIKKPKPNPEIYLEACKGIGCNVNECIGFEDASLGIEGLNKANIFCVGINPNNEYVKQNCNFYLQSTKEINFEDIKKAYDDFMEKIN